MESELKPVWDNLYIVRSRPILYAERDDAFIVSDIHLGYEEAMISHGVFLPRLQLRKAVTLLSDARSTVEAKKIIINGDIKHAFEKLLKQEKVEVEEFILKLQSIGFKDVIFVRGNHDNYVTPLLRKLGVTIIDDILDLSSGVRVTHGHLDIEPAGEVTIIGHEHPAVQINVSGSKIKLAALLLVPTTIGSSHIIVMPALGVYQTGNVVTLERDKFLSPLVKRYGVIEDIIPIIVDETLGVIPLPELKNMGGL